MAITTLDGALAGMRPPVGIAKALSGTLVAGRYQSFWPVAGLPGAGAYNATLNGANLTNADAGSLQHVNPGTGNSYLARLQLAATQACTVFLIDRLWNNQLTVNVTTLQSITQPALPARDNAGTTNGDGVLLAIETSAAASATAASLGTAGVIYTNQAGTASRTAGFAVAPTATATIAGAWFPIGLQAGDTGVRSVQSVQFTTAWTTGTINLVAYRILAALELPGALIPNAIDAITAGFPRIFDSSCLSLVMLPNTTTTSNLIGTFVETQG